jgi:hypothetical protein
VKLQRERLQVVAVREHVLVTLFAQVSKVVNYLSSCAFQNFVVSKTQSALNISQ